MEVIKGKHHRFIVCVLAGLGIQATFAASQPVISSSDALHSIFNMKYYQPLVTLTIGPDFVDKGQSQSLTLLPPFHNYYSAHGSQETVVDGGGFFRCRASPD